MDDERYERSARPTIKVSKEDMDAILEVDAAVAERETKHTRPTVFMQAVRPPRS